MTAETAAMIMMSGGSPKRDKLKEICECPKLDVELPIDETFHFTFHVRWSDDIEEYNSGWASIYSYSPELNPGAFTYPIFRKNLQLWLVCWKNNIAQYAAMLSTQYYSSSAASYAIWTADNDYYDIFYLTNKYTALLDTVFDSKINGKFKLDFKRFTGEWSGSVSTYLYMRNESFSYVPTSDNLSIGHLKKTSDSEQRVGMGASNFNILPAYNGSATNLTYDELTDVCVDLCLAILNSNGIKATKWTVLKPD